ncbi:hypothetical protein ACOQFL_06220 [Actinopolyspora sp. H202]
MTSNTGAAISREIAAPFGFRTRPHAIVEADEPVHRRTLMLVAWRSLCV